MRAITAYILKVHGTKKDVSFYRKLCTLTSNKLFSKKVLMVDFFWQFGVDGENKFSFQFENWFVINVCFLTGRNLNEHWFFQDHNLSSITRLTDALTAVAVHEQIVVMFKKIKSTWIYYRQLSEEKFW